MVIFMSHNPMPVKSVYIFENLENTQQKSRSNQTEFKRRLFGGTEANNCVISKYNQSFILLIKYPWVFEFVPPMYRLGLK